MKRATTILLAIGCNLSGGDYACRNNIWQKHVRKLRAKKVGYAFFRKCVAQGPCEQSGVLRDCRLQHLFSVAEHSLHFSPQKNIDKTPKGTNVCSTLHICIEESSQLSQDTRVPNKWAVWNKQARYNKQASIEGREESENLSGINKQDGLNLVNEPTINGRAKC